MGSGRANACRAVPVCVCGAAELLRALAASARAPRASALALRWRAPQAAGALRLWLRWRLARALPCTRHARAMQRPPPGRRAHECASAPSPAVQRREGAADLEGQAARRTGRARTRRRWTRRPWSRRWWARRTRRRGRRGRGDLQREAGRDDGLGGEGGLSSPTACGARHRRGSACVRRERTNAAIARWADIALAGGAGRAFTCHSPRLGRVGHVGRAKRMDARALAQLERLSRSPCLWAATPVAVKRARCQVRWCAEAEGSGRRASRAGGVQEAGQSAPPRSRLD